jgi:hypothetical protein
MSVGRDITPTLQPSQARANPSANWYNLNVSVSGSNSWTVTVDMVAPAVVYSTWNVNATWPSEYVMEATPNQRK